ncbi:MAG TPA: nucleotide pyrophosphohydrolase [Candidatus Saccharimonadales bacterium]|nr:nucleotide pyrophosphohydrolase [Candidatus Saccharimonadales bacterium]
MRDKTDADTTVQELKDAIIAFRDERGWQRAHSPRNLATSIAVEAAELLEHFQWGDLQERDRQDIADELADIVHYCLDFAAVMNIDVSTACRHKLAEIQAKYPTKIFNPANTDDEDAYRAARRAHKAKRAGV